MTIIKSSFENIRTALKEKIFYVRYKFKFGGPKDGNFQTDCCEDQKCGSRDGDKHAGQLRGPACRKDRRTKGKIECDVV